MRIIAGTHRGRALQTPQDGAVRPTSDKVRGAIFNIIAHAGFSNVVLDTQLRVADVFCGTGALGLEALSRGAGHAVFVDSSPTALALARRNAEHLKCGAACTFLQADAAQLPTAGAPCGLVFLDAPYHKNLVPPALAALAAQGWLAGNALVVVESARDEAFSAPAPFSLHETRCYGDTAVHFLSAPPA